MKAIVHIGIPKTGSSTIQAFLDINRDRLAAQSVLVPRALGRRNHRRLSVMAGAVENQGLFLLKKGIRSPEDCAAQIADWTGAWDAELAKSACDTCLISSEHLHSRLTDTNAIRALHRLLADRFDDIRVVLYIRDQLDQARSLLSTVLKNGGADPRLRPPDAYPDLDYQRGIETWGSIFGTEKLSVRLFERDAFQGGDLLSDFATTCGFDAGGMVRPENRNTRLDALGQRLMRQFNQRIPALDGDAPNPLRADIIRFLDLHFSSGDLPAAAPDQAAAFAAQFAKSNDWVRQRYFAHRETLFTPRPSEAAAAPAPAPDSAEAGDINRLISAFITLWEEKQAAINRKRP